MKIRAILLSLIVCIGFKASAQDINRGALNIIGPVKSVEMKTDRGMTTVITFDKEGKVLSKKLNDQVLFCYDWSDLDEGEAMYTVVNLSTGEALQKDYQYINLLTPERIEMEEGLAECVLTFKKNGMVETVIVTMTPNVVKHVTHYKTEDSLLPEYIEMFQNDNLAARVDIEIHETDTHGNATSYTRKLNGQEEHVNATFSYFE